MLKYGGGSGFRLRLPEGRYHFELGPIRPPSEGQDRSLLIRVNRNCPWNRCAFCNTYKGTRFEYRSVEEIHADLAVVKSLADGLKAGSWAMGLAGQITQEVVAAAIRGTPEVYSTGAEEELAARLHSLTTTAAWLASGARTVFLQDANAVVMRVPELLAVLADIKTLFPTVSRVTSYARSKTIAQRTGDELIALRAAGLKRLHVGLESGSDDVLALMDKGVKAEEHVVAGRKIKAAGITLSEYVMPGLGGKALSRQHAVESARVLNAIDPDFIRLRSLIVRRDSGLDDLAAAGGFEEIGEDEVVEEIRLFVASLNCHSLLASDQMSNLLVEIEGKLPDDKARILGIIQQYQELTPMDRLRFRLQRRLGSHVAVRGGLAPALKQQVDVANEAIAREADDAAEKVDAAVRLLKQGFA